MASAKVTNKHVSGSVGCLLGVPGHQWLFLALTGTICWLGTNFGVFFTTLSLNNAIFCVIFCYL